MGRIWERPITYRAGTKTCPQPPAFACAACDCYTKSVSLSGNVCHVITGGQSANGRCRLIWESPGHVHQTLHVELPFVRHGEHDFIHDARFALRSFVGLGRGAEKRIGHGLRVRQRVPCVRRRLLVDVYVPGLYPLAHAGDAVAVQQLVPPGRAFLGRGGGHDTVRGAVAVLFDLRAVPFGKKLSISLVWANIDGIWEMQKIPTFVTRYTARNPGPGKRRSSRWRPLIR